MKNLRITILVLALCSAVLSFSNALTLQRARTWKEKYETAKDKTERIERVMFNCGAQSAMTVIYTDFIQSGGKLSSTDPTTLNERAWLVFTTK